MWLERRGARQEATQLRDASTHLLRHTFGTHALQLGSSLQNVRQVLEHDALFTMKCAAYNDRSWLICL